MAVLFKFEKKPRNVRTVTFQEHRGRFSRRSYTWRENGGHRHGLWLLEQLERGYSNKQSVTDCWTAGEAVPSLGWILLPRSMNGKRISEDKWTEISLLLCSPLGRSAYKSYSCCQVSGRLCAGKHLGSCQPAGLFPEALPPPTPSWPPYLSHQSWRWHEVIPVVANELLCAVFWPERGQVNSWNTSGRLSHVTTNTSFLLYSLAFS